MPAMVQHFSDVLCVWAYLGQIRVDELQTRFGSQVVLQWRYIDLFGDTDQKIGEGWAKRGGWQGYADHVQQLVGRFAHVSVNSHTWASVRPASSAPAHQMLVGVRMLEERGEAPVGSEAKLAWAIREAFFRDARDVADWGVLNHILRELGGPGQELQRLRERGELHARLCRDYSLRAANGIQGSPTLLLDGGRQKLYGNVGYRVIEANVLEHLERRGEDFASWC
ncbi:MAG: putative DsbA family dithiol-disulfide isomerase [Kiritimatiellia bacterium]|jgi:predicted DsbA family dithiol-disulfide isomerase